MEQLTRQQIMSIPAPARTRSWNPVAHGDVLLSLEAALKTIGIGVRNERYSVSKKGSCFFGTWTLDHEIDGKMPQIGFRNSTNKMFAIGICAGTCVIVCSNMMFDGQFVEFRKHTGLLSISELQQIGVQAIRQVITQSEIMIGWQNTLRSFKLSQNNLKCITYDAMAAHILNPSEFNRFCGAVDEEVQLAKETTLYQFHGAITRMVRDQSLFQVAARTESLSKLCEQYMIVRRKR